MFPIHINLSFFHKQFYEGLYFAIAILVGVIIAVRLLKKEKVSSNEYTNVLFFSVLGGILGARIFAVIFWPGFDFLKEPLRIFAIWEGGMSITGGIAGALLTAIIVTRKTKLQFYGYLALLAPTLLISQGIGRIGCFLNGDGFGVATNLPWGVNFPRYGTNIPDFTLDKTADSAAWLWANKQGLVTPDSTQTVAMHPTQLYEALFDFGFAAFLLLHYKKAQNKKFTAFAYIFGYSLFRYLVEYVRGDREVIVALNTSAIQFVLLGVSIVTGILMILSLKKPEGLLKKATK